MTTDKKKLNRQAKDEPEKKHSSANPKQESTTKDHVGKHINKKRSENQTDLDVKNKVTGADLDAPPA